METPRWGLAGPSAPQTTGTTPPGGWTDGTTWPDVYPPDLPVLAPGRWPCAPALQWALGTEKQLTHPQVPSENSQTKG